MTPDHRGTIEARIDEFARGWVAGRDGLAERHDFPADLWAALGRSGLLGLALPEEFGGLGGGYRALASAAHRMNAAGGVMGVTLSWLCHIMNARLHLMRRGTAEQKARWLPMLARGETTLAIAISEPGVGAHPKHLKTRARLDGDEWVIDGEKSYLTNGPLAGLFIVLAVTGENAGRKTFSAIMVPREAPGFAQTPGVEIDFLHPSPHCGIKLDECRVPAANLLGSADGGLNEISLPMRAIEDALNTSTKAGAMRAQLRLLAPHVGDDATETFGDLLARVQGLEAIAENLASELDENDLDSQRLTPVTAGFRSFAKTLQHDIDAFVETHDIELDPALRHLRYDMVKSLGIAGYVHRIQAAKRAQAFISGERE